MKKDKKITYFFIIALFLTLFFNFFVLNILKNKIFFAISIVIYTICCVKTVKSKRIENKDRAKINILITLLSILHIAILYIIGFIVGFYKNQNATSIVQTIINIICITLIIISSEMIRKAFILKQNKKLSILTTINLILIDICIYYSQYNLQTLANVLSFIGFVVLSSISINIFGNYLTKKGGITATIIFKIIIIGYTFILPKLPNIYMFFYSSYRIIYPYLMYLLIENMFREEKFKLAIKRKTVTLISTIAFLIISIFIVMLVSCKFKFGIIVIGSKSMTGSINKGDAIIFERYENQKLKEGQVIIFRKDSIRTVHRIEKIKILNDEKVYYTKGDVNQKIDDGYRKEEDIIGVVNFKIAYIGLPTLWVNNLFNK